MVEQQPRGDCAAKHRDECADRHQALNRSLFAAQPAHLQVEATLEEDHRHREFDDRVETVPEIARAYPTEAIGAEGGARRKK